MYRRAVVWGMVVVLGLGVRGLAAPTPAGVRDKGDELADALKKTVKFEGYDDPKMTLIEALDNLAKHYDLSFDVNETAFKLEMVPEVIKTEVAQPNPILPMSAPLGTVLKKVLARVPVPSGATYIIRREVIEITTGEALRKEIWGEDYGAPTLPLVRGNFEKLPLREALRELAQQAEYNIVLDSAVDEEAAKTPVTAKLRNAPLDTAVRLLADMADLRSVQTANVLYVTTPEKADALRARLKAGRSPEKKAAPPQTAEKTTRDAAGAAAAPKKP